MATEGSGRVMTHHSQSVYLMLMFCEIIQVHQTIGAQL